MCKASQQKQVQTDGSPRLQAPPGAAIALRWQENGHVSFPQTPPGKAENSGEVYVYGTTQPKSDEQFEDIHNVWNADGSGGDKRGALLSVSTYDDGRCYQLTGASDIAVQRKQQFPHSQGKDMFCQQDIALPANAPTGQPYTLYWVWDWSTEAGTEGLPNGKPEIYTSCMDVDIVADNGASQKSSGSGYIQDQPFENAAIPEQFAKLQDAPTVPVVSGSQSSPAASSSNSQPGRTTQSSVLATSAAASSSQAVSSQAGSATRTRGPFNSQSTVFPMPPPDATTQPGRSSASQLSSTPSSKSSTPPSRQSSSQSSSLSDSRPTGQSSSQSSSLSGGRPTSQSIGQPTSQAPQASSNSGDTTPCGLVNITLTIPVPVALPSNTQPTFISTATATDFVTRTVDMTIYPSNFPTGTSRGRGGKHNDNNKARRAAQGDDAEAEMPLQVVPVTSLGSRSSLPSFTAPKSMTTLATFRALKPAVTASTSYSLAIADFVPSNSTISLSSSAQKTNIVVVTVTETSTVVGSTPTAQAFKIRGRSPLFMLPESNSPAESQIETETESTTPAPTFKTFRRPSRLPFRA